MKVRKTVYDQGVSALRRIGAGVRLTVCPVLFEEQAIDKGETSNGVAGGRTWPAYPGRRASFNPQRPVEAQRRMEAQRPMTNAKPEPETELSTLQLALEGPIAAVTLHRPEVLHALNSTMFDELERLFTTLAGDPAVRVVIITGSGDRAFAAGADIRALAETDAATGTSAAQRGHQVFGLIHTQLERAGKPVIGAINGVALGGGCELALACTLRIASETARLGFPEVKLGLIPGYGGTQRLTRLIGRSRALRLMLSAHIANASEALQLGLVDEVVPAAELLPRARALAGAIAAMAPLAVAGVLESVARGEDHLLAEALDTEAEIFGRLCATADKQEGLSAFLAKRPPVWQGR